MSQPSFDPLSEENLRLDTTGRMAVGAAVDSIVKERDSNGPGVMDLRDPYQVAAAYVEYGWSTRTGQIPPGKNLWIRADVGFVGRYYRYPQDTFLSGHQSLTKTLCLPGDSMTTAVQAVFEGMQAQHRIMRAERERAEKRKREEEPDDRSEQVRIDLVQS